MHVLSSVVLSVVIYCGLAAGGAAALAQSAKDLIGTWTLVSVVIDQGGTKTEPFGPAPKGMAVFDGTHQSIIIVRSDMPKFASNNRNTGTPDENKASVQGSLALFGPYSYDEASKSISGKIEGSNFPNWFGTDLKRGVRLDGASLILTNPTPSASGPGGVATITWKRAK